MELFTVTLKRKIIITRYEGRSVIEKTDLIEEIYRDLPLTTANRYKTLFPENDVQITRQDPIETSGGRVSVKIGAQATKMGQRAAFGDKELPEPKSNFKLDKREARQSRAKPADKTAETYNEGYADVINRMVEEAA